MTTELVQQGSTEELRVVGGKFTTPDRLKMLGDTHMPGAPMHEVLRFALFCEARGLNPDAKQIYPILRKTRNKKKDVGNEWGYDYNWTYQTSIDGFRSIADGNDQYDGKEFKYAGDDGVWHDDWFQSTPPSFVKCLIYRKDRSRPEVAVADLSFYQQTTTYNGNTRPTAMWAKGARHMLAKCAEALAIRMAFPERAGGIYISEEMGQAEVLDVTTAPTEAPLPPKSTVQKLAEKSTKQLNKAPEPEAKPDTQAPDENDQSDYAKILADEFDTATTLDKVNEIVGKINQAGFTGDVRAGLVAMYKRALARIQREQS